MGLFGKKKQKNPALQEPAVVKGTAAARPGKSGGNQWIFRGLAVSLACAVIFSCFYGFFRAHAERNMSGSIESEGNIFWLYQNCYLLYRDLYNAGQEAQEDYIGLYLEAEAGKEWLLDEDKLRERLNLWSDSGERLVDGGDLPQVQEGMDMPETPEEAEDREELTYYDLEMLLLGLTNLNEYFESLETYFEHLNNSYDYLIRDNVSGRYVTNMSRADMERKEGAQYFLLSFTFDSMGNVTVGDTIRGTDEGQIRKAANEVIRDNTMQNLASQMGRYVRVKTPRDCTVTFAISQNAWGGRGSRHDYSKWGGYPISDGYRFSYRIYMYQDAVDAYYSGGVGTYLLLCLCAVALAGVFLPLKNGAKPWKTARLCAAAPLEALAAGGICLCALEYDMVQLVADVAEGRAQRAISGILPEPEFWVGAFNLLVLALYFFCGWYIGVCARALRELGVKQYIKQKSMVYRFFPFVKGKIVGFYDSLVRIDLTRNANRTIMKLLAVNALILFFISSLWLGGFAITLVYSVVLYVILRKYVSDLQEKYRILFRAVDEIADGNLNIPITEDLGVFEPFRIQLFKIQEGLKKAVAMEVRSQRIKTELVTNMSHDLKTPLTAIITYVNLLRKGNVTEEQREEYLEILERKSLRLKTLIEDLFEFSKANSQNVTLNIMDVDIMNLVKQVAFEMSDKIDASGLDVRMNLTEEKVILPLDSQKTYRIYENLFANIAKYALGGTRVYVNGFRIDDTVVITLKNISAQEITVEASELTERFVRGNASRSTEGSGLGLAIAKSFMELQGGTLELEVDGDLFKVTTTWHRKTEEEPVK